MKTGIYFIYLISLLYHVKIVWYLIQAVNPIQVYLYTLHCHAPAVLLGRISYSSPSSRLVLTFSLCKYLCIRVSISKNLSEIQADFKSLPNTVYPLGRLSVYYHYVIMDFLLRSNRLSGILDY